MPKKSNDNAKALRLLASMNRNLTFISKSVARIEARQDRAEIERIYQKKTAQKVAAVAFETIGRISPEMAKHFAPFVEALRAEKL